jgi:predicted TIM-barrel fold metal-dependent hydrolase
MRENVVDTVLSLMDTHKIERAVVFPGTEIVPDNIGMAGVIAAHRDRFLPFAWINPAIDIREAANELSRLVEEKGFVGMKLHPLFHAFFPNRPFIRPLMERCRHYGLPVLVHSGHSPYCTPWQVAELAAEYPDISFIMDHMGYQYGWVDDAIIQAEKYPNIILGTTAMPFHEKIKLAVETIGAHRVVYGSDAPSIHPLPEIQRVRLAGLSPEEETLVLGGNISRLLKLKN